MDTTRLLAAISLLVMMLPGVAAGNRTLEPSGPVLELALLKERCIEFSGIKAGPDDIDIADCRLSDFGVIGAVEGRTYYYALYCLIPRWAIAQGKCDAGPDSFNATHYRQQAAAIFVQGEVAETARLVLEQASLEPGMFHYEKPGFIRNPFGTILHLHVEWTGTGHGNASQYFLRTSHGWRVIDSEAWLTELRGRLPAGLEIRKGLWPDLVTMTASAGLYKQGDANCCPTGGEARTSLSLENERFVIKGLKILPGKDATTE